MNSQNTKLVWGFATALAIAVIFGIFQKIQADNISAQDLKSALNKKTQELADISNQIKDTQKQLETTQNQKSSLQGELSQINNTTKQVNLSIKSSQILIDTYSLQIDQLQNDISDAERNIENKKSAVADALRKLQQQEEIGGPLEIFLKNQDLSESVFQIQGLIDLQSQLKQDVSDLNTLKEQMSGDLNAVSDRKTAKETENTNLKNKQTILTEIKKDKEQFLEQTKNKEKNYQKYLSDLQNKQTEIAAEIEKIDEELRAKINPGALPARVPGVLAMPVTGAVSQGYGATAFAQGGYRGKWHNGIDFAAPIGTPVFAAEKGRVAAIGDQDKYCYRGAYGKFAVIEHENNLATLYAHFSLVSVKPGATVNRGDLIGYVGRTGYATGPHLHFTVFAGATFYMGSSRTCGPMPYGGDLNPNGYL